MTARKRPTTPIRYVCPDHGHVMTVPHLRDDENRLRVARIPCPRCGTDTEAELHGQPIRQ